MQKQLDIVIPCYNEEKNIRKVFFEVKHYLEQLITDNEISFSIVYVDDGSSDNTMKEIKKMEDEFGEKAIKYVSFSRNFGKEAAIFAGLQATTGEFVVLMDCDLQHPPSLIPDMFNAVVKEGYDCCGAMRKDRKGEGATRSFFSSGFYKFMNKISDIDLKEGATDFRLMKRCFVNSVLSLSERERFTKGIFAWVGYNTKWIEYENIERAEGETKWSFWGLMKYALNGITSFSTMPLKIASFIGMFFVLFAVGYSIFTLIDTLVRGPITAGFPTTIILILLIGGIIIILLGIIGEYLARVFTEVKRRPQYISKDTNVEKIKNETPDK